MGLAEETGNFQISGTARVTSPHRTAGWAGLSDTLKPLISVSSSSSRLSVLQDSEDHPSIPCLPILTSILATLTLRSCCVAVLH